ncbi:2-succinylbenzoate-CoA ligase [filamentous cyanobacterium CCT1]|nr:2-succinylbenzoate-CoA ligase [filamentous cyanobacterium CCT1]PSN80479.1 2-succinylbenzoate-CoA ligase [filamentous cyanobacterium CCP4]
MGQTLRDVLRDRRGDDWLIGLSSQDFWQQLATLTPVFAAHGASCFGAGVLIAETDSLQFLVACLAAWAEGCVVVLANPRWGQQERQQITDMVAPEWNAPLASGLGAYPCQVPGTKPGQILIPTGGSSGHIKFAVHTWETLLASVEGFCAHFGVERVNSYCVLPLFHVSGFMQVLRVLASGGQLAIQPYGDLKRGEQLGLPPGGYLSLVPTQLQDLLGLGDEVIHWLRSFRAVLLGGGPAGRSLLDQARAAQIPVALTYGMTETAAQVATLLPKEFLAGHRSSGKPLPHVRITILDDRGRPLPPGEVGRVTVQGRSLALGYLGRGGGEHGLVVGSAHPTVQSATAILATDDMGYFDDLGYLHLVGRSSTKIITGGENVFPEDVEAALLTLDGVRDVCVVGLPCDRWGQQLCALVVMATPARLQDLSGLLNPLVAAYKRPKQWILVSALPRTPQGKLSRPQALALAQRILGIER